MNSHGTNTIFLKSSAATVGMLLGMAAATVAVRLPGPLAAINISAMIVGLAFLVVLVQQRERLYLLRLTTLDLALVAFVGVRILTDLIDSAVLDVALPMAALGDWLVILLAYFSARSCVSTQGDLLEFFRSLVVPSYFVAAIAMAQVAGIGFVNALISTFTRSVGLDNRVLAGWTELRATSTIGHWTALGGYLVVMIAVNCAVLAYMTAQREVKTWRYAIGVSVLIGGLLSTATFAPILAGFVVAVLTGFFYFRRVDFLLVASVPFCVLGYLLYPLLSGRYEKQTEVLSTSTPYPWLPESIGYRVNIWVTESIPGGLQRELFGWGSWVYSRIGESTAPSELRWTSPESEWIRSFVTGGWTLLVVEAVLLFLLVVLMIRASKGEMAWARPIMWGIVSLIVISTIHSHFTNRGVPLALWPTAAAMLSVLLTAEKRTVGIRPHATAVSSLAGRHRSLRNFGADRESASVDDQIHRVMKGDS